ncbi:Isocitrate dehydrogenase [NAD] subunit gamma, mitochondrial [Oryzias melastigma]|uniref:Isocitrate dehydrogenase [NAD] subunit gamma, mitochondrial n=1 Tax=Oryzias melastigma TaxID=30732 RepID=A0A834F817_ORYME|nr:Isocitrate dehydrogenase [NAD] subunit gamma, mitochondrial [Oryzias melastigma]
MAAHSSLLSVFKIINPRWNGRIGNTVKVFGTTFTSHRNKTSLTRENIPPPAKYGGRHTVTLIPGDGIGPELLSHVKEVFRFSCVPVDFEVVQVNSAMEGEDDIMNAITAIRRNGVALKGNIETKHTLPPSVKSRNNVLRTTLDLYANVMHCQSLPGVQTRHQNIDIMIIRENTEGEYSSLEHESVSGVVESLKIITRNNSLRIADYAFRLAREKGRRRVTAVHKANIMKLGDGLFLQCCKEVASGYPDITFDSMIVDNTTMQLVSKPQQFDVMVMPNLYGNVVSNVCAGLVGGPGLVPGANYGQDYAVFETAYKEHRKELYEHASSIRNAVSITMNETRLHTADLGGQGTTSEVVQSIMRVIQTTCCSHWTCPRPTPGILTCQRSSGVNSAQTTVTFNCASPGVSLASAASRKVWIYSVCQIKELCGVNPDGRNCWSQGRWT